MIVGQATEDSVTTGDIPWIPHPNLSAYFIRLALQPQQPPLGSYQAGQFQPSESGLIVADEWVRSATNLKGSESGLIVADEWVRSATNLKGSEIDQWMLTHRELWGIVFLQPPAVPLDQAQFLSPQTAQKPWLLSSFITSFKAAAAKRIHLRCNQLGQPVWQCGYQDHYLQDAAALAHSREHMSAAQRSRGG